MLNYWLKKESIFATIAIYLNGVKVGFANYVMAAAVATCLPNAERLMKNALKGSGKC